MKIQVIKKATPRAGADVVCPWFVDCPDGAEEELDFRPSCAGAHARAADNSMYNRVRLNRRPPAPAQLWHTHRSPQASWCAASDVLLGRARSVVVTALLLPLGASASCGGRQTTCAISRSSHAALWRRTPQNPRRRRWASGPSSTASFRNPLSALGPTASPSRVSPRPGSGKTTTSRSSFVSATGLKFHDGTPVDNRVHQGEPREGVQDLAALSATRASSGIDMLEEQHRRDQAVPAGSLAPGRLVECHYLDKRSDEGRHRARPVPMLERGPRTRLAAFADFYRGKPKIDSIEILEFEEQRTSWAALMRGQIDAVHEILPSAIEFLQAEGQTNVRTFPFTRPYFIYPAVQRQAPGSEGCQGSSGAELRGRSPGHHRSRTGSARGPSPTARFGHSALGLQHGAEDTTRTTSKRRRSASTPPASGSRGRGAGHMPSRFRFKCLTLEKHATFEKIALLLQKQLSEIGVDMEIEAVPLDGVGQTRRKR